MNPSQLFAIRFALTLMAMGSCCCALRVTMFIPELRVILSDMLEGKPLPELTQVVIRCHIPFVILDWVLIAAVVGLLFRRPTAKTFYLMATIGIIAILQCGLIFEALFAPFHDILFTIQSATGTIASCGIPLFQWCN